MGHGRGDTTAVTTKGSPMSRTLALVAALTLAAAPAFAQGTERFRIWNRSCMTLTTVTTSAVANPYWGNNLLAERNLRNGQYLDVTVPNVSLCAYDILFEFADGQALTDVIDVCNLETYTVQP